MKEKKKGQAGAAVGFMTRNAALRKLQISLAQFRKLCIMKGVYPREPKKKLHGRNKTYYYTKDIIFLSHEPLLKVFREQKVQKRKIKKAVGRKERDSVERLKNTMPSYELDHIIKERYPQFQDALADLDDALCMIHLFSFLRQSNQIPNEMIEVSQKLADEFNAYVIKTQSLRKVFISIKGIYYQATIFGQNITWLTPHKTTQKQPKDVDFLIMLNFLELYHTLMSFVLYKLYHSIGLSYPPLPIHKQQSNVEYRGLDALLKHIEKSIPNDLEDNKESHQKSELQKKTESRIGSLNSKKLLELEKKGKEDIKDETENLEEANGNSDALQLKFDQETNQALDVNLNLFKGKKFFLSRETPVSSLEFVILCFGGEVSWEASSAPYPENDESITHQVVDRNFQKHQYLSRTYIQPQWVYDCVNEGILLDTSEYGPTSTLPPHLSPFVNDTQEGYTPARRDYLNLFRAQQLGIESTSKSTNAEPQRLSVKSKQQTLEDKYSAELQAELEGKSFEMPQKVSKRKRSEDQELDIEDDENEIEDDKEVKQNEEEEVPESTPAGAEIMMSSKKRRLYNRMKFAIKKKQEKTKALMEKRKQVEKKK